jgi:hypothetical protein
METSLACRLDIHDAAEYRFGLSKLLPAVDVQRFGDGYVAISALARRFHVNSGSLTRYLNASGTPLRAIPLPDAGTGHTFFLCKDIAAQIRIPGRRMMREVAERRIVADRKKRWAKYGLAKETASGEPMRRVRLNYQRTPGK